MSNLNYEAALKYIDLGSYDKAVEKLKLAIDEESSKTTISAQQSTAASSANFSHSLARKKKLARNSHRLFSLPMKTTCSPLSVQ